MALVKVQDIFKSGKKEAFLRANKTIFISDALAKSVGADQPNTYANYFVDDDQLGLNELIVLFVKKDENTDVTGLNKVCKDKDGYNFRVSNVLELFDIKVNKKKKIEYLAREEAPSSLKFNLDFNEDVSTGVLETEEKNNDLFEDIKSE